MSALSPNQIYDVLRYPEPMPQLEWQQVDWTVIPVTEVSSVSLRSERSAGYDASVASIVTDSDILEHPGISVDDLLDLYRDSGFDTDVILQNPFTHLGPAAACTIGFPLNLPGALQFQDLKRYRRWICRIHVDIKQKGNGTLFSFPHVEVDPAFHWAEHLAHQGQEVHGRTSVEILKMLLA
jgi:hypothetical protein